MKLFLYLFLFTTALFSKNLIDMYRIDGISEVEKYLNSKLTDKAYWEEFFTDKDVSLGYYETKKVVVLTKKNNKKIEVYNARNNQFIKLFENDVITGEIEGDKLIEGDKKTPIGVYDIVQKKDDVDSFYGPMALVTSYPNTYDKARNKNGYGIWIHGMPLDGNRELFTQGCIALDNDKLVELDTHLNHDKTLLITTHEKIEPISKSEMAKVMAFIYDWRYHWKVSDFNKYIDFYSKDFKRKNQSGYNQFYNHKKLVFSRNENKTINFSNFDISPYPNDDNKRLFRILMDQVYKSPAVDFKGKKELIVMLENNDIKILMED